MTKIIFIPDNKKIHESENLLRGVIEYLGLKSHHNAKKMGILFFRNAESKAYRKNTFPLESLKGYKYIFISPSELSNLNIRDGNDIKILNKDDKDDLIGLISKSGIFELTGVPLGYLAFVRRVGGVESGQYEFDLIEISRFGNENLSEETIVNRIRNPRSEFWKGYRPMVFSREINIKSLPGKIRESGVGGWVKLEIDNIGTQKNGVKLTHPFDVYGFDISDPSEDNDEKTRGLIKLVSKEFKIYDELLSESEAQYDSITKSLESKILSIVQDAEVVINKVGQGLSVSYEMTPKDKTEKEVAMFYDIGRDYWTAWTGTEKISEDLIIILSHWHYDHYQAYFRGMLKLNLRKTGVKWILPTDNEPLSPSAKNLLTEINAISPGKFVFLRPGDCLLPEGSSFHIYALKPADSERNNHGLIVFDGQKSYLLPGDANYNLIYNGGSCCNCFCHHTDGFSDHCFYLSLPTIIIATHHGGDYGSIALPKADRVIFSYGKNSYKHPNPQKDEFLTQHPPPDQDYTEIGKIIL